MIELVMDFVLKLEKHLTRRKDKHLTSVKVGLFQRPPSVFIYSSIFFIKTISWCNQTWKTTVFHGQKAKKALLTAVFQQIWHI